MRKWPKKWPKVKKIFFAAKMTLNTNFAITERECAKNWSRYVFFWFSSRTAKVAIKWPKSQKICFVTKTTLDPNFAFTM